MTLKSLHQNTPFIKLMTAKFISTYSCDSVKLFQKTDLLLIETLYF